jgi:hypothetical protein
MTSCCVPRPNIAIWDVDVFIAGGTPASPTGDQGDVFELETPGTQAVVFTPTGPDTATIDVVTLSSLITIAPFTSPVSVCLLAGRRGADRL